MALLVDYTFVPIDNGDALLDALNELFGALQSNGQVWGPYVAGRVGGAIRATCMVPRRDALAEHHGSQWVRESFDRVRALCAHAPTWQVVDERPGSTRTWSDERELYLYTHVFDETSPVCAGSDGDPLPLYMLPVDDETRKGLTHWMAQYRRYDHLQLDCGPLEVEGYRQLADPASELAGEGRELARDVERATRLPTYYYLMRYWGWADRDEAERRCPGCGQPWKNPGERTTSGLAWFDFRCEPCRLVSHIASSSDDQDGHPQMIPFIVEDTRVEWNGPHEHTRVADHRCAPRTSRRHPKRACHGRGAGCVRIELRSDSARLSLVPRTLRWRCCRAEWLDDIHKLPDSHRKFQSECGEGGWTLRDVFIIGWDGGGNPFGISTKTGEVLVEDHDFGGIHVLAPSFEIFLAEALGVLPSASDTPHEA